MIRFFIILILIFLQSCSKPKTVLICGDHICVNKKEAEKYFEENLSLEVKIVDDSKEDYFDLVELNLQEGKEKKVINIVKKEKTNKEVKILSKEEIKLIKTKIKKKNIKQRIVKQKLNTQERKLKETTISKKVNKNIVNKSSDVFDICTILDKCSIDEISKYLIKTGKKKIFQI